MTDKNIPSSSEPKDLHESPVPTEQPVSSKDKDKSKEKSSIVSSKNKTAKIALLALITAIAGCTGLFVWQQQQNQLLSQQIELNNTKLVQQYQKQTKQILTQQKNIFNQQLSEITSQINVLKDKNIDELSKSVQRLEKNIKQRQPSDWLLHETEYLIRIAARTLWLEHDTATAISLLKDADARLAELNNPSFLSIREIIHQDIKSLELMPTLQTDEIILALMAMNKQIDILPLTMMNLGKEPHQRESLELSDDINDWQSNLAKTWQQFLDDFISISQKTGAIEPLMAPEQQKHLKQNLSLKIQLAIWSASERKSEIYHKTLAEIEQWLNEFFDMQNEYNQRFAQGLITLQKQHVSYDYPNELAALPAIRSALTKQLNSLPNKTVTIIETVPETTDEVDPKTLNTITVDNAAENAADNVTSKLKAEPNETDEIDEIKVNNEGGEL